MNKISQRRLLEKKVPFIAPDCSTIFAVRQVQKNPKESLEKKIEEPLDQSFSTDNSLTTTIDEFFKNSDDVKMQECEEEFGDRSSSSISETDAPDVAKICKECESKNKTIEGLNKEIDQVVEQTEKSLLGKKDAPKLLILELVDAKTLAVSSR